MVVSFEGDKMKFRNFGFHERRSLFPFSVLYKELRFFPDNLIAAITAAADKEPFKVLCSKRLSGDE